MRKELSGKPTMRRPQRLIAAAILVALSGALAGCGGGGLGNFDPSDLLDFLDTKKKLPGERKPVFPEGVPGLEQGVPNDLYRGARQQDDPNAQAAAAVPPPVGEPKSKRGAKAKGKQAAARADRAAGTQAGQDHAQAHHRAASRSLDRASTLFAAVGFAVPGADAERHFHALTRSVFKRSGSPVRVKKTRQKEIKAPLQF